MAISKNNLYKQLGINTLIITVLFGVGAFILTLIGEIKEFDVIYFIGSVFAGAYALTIVNPYNYIAFSMAATSSIIFCYALWGVNMNMVYTYLLVFFPCQVYSYFVWKKMYIEDKAAGGLRFLTIKELVFVKLAFLFIVLVDFLIINDSSDPNNDIIFNILNALFLGLAIGSNVLTNRKVTDAAIYWVVFSTCGLVISFYNGNIDYYMLFIFTVFLLVNFKLLYNWVKFTPKESYGWVKLFVK